MYDIKDWKVATTVIILNLFIKGQSKLIKESSLKRYLGSFRIYTRGKSEDLSVKSKNWYFRIRKKKKKKKNLYRDSRATAYINIYVHSRRHDTVYHSSISVRP